MTRGLTTAVKNALAFNRSETQKWIIVIIIAFILFLI